MVLAQLLTLCSGFIAASSYTPHIIIITVDDIVSITNNVL